MKKPKPPAEDPSTIALRQQQIVDLSRLDEEQNLRVKQLLLGQRGGRFFRGSPSMRALPGNSAGNSPGSNPATGGYSAPDVGGITRSILSSRLNSAYAGMNRQ